MGEMSDYYLEQEDPFDPIETYWRGEKSPDDGPPYDRRLQPTATTWVTRDGQRINVSDMTDSHLVNTIRYLRRTAECRMMRSVLAVGMSDAAEMALGTEFDNLDKDDYAAAVAPSFPAMLAEAGRRGLRI